MKKFLNIKKIIMIFLVLGILFFGAASISASSLKDRDAQIQYIPYDGYAYNIATKNTYTDISWKHYHSNPGSTTDTVTHTVSRTKSSSANVSASTSFNVMVTKVGIGTEIGWGKSNLVETSVTYTIPAKTNYELQYGSRAVKTTGYEVKYSRGRVIEKNFVKGNWTYSGFSTKVKK